MSFPDDINEPISDSEFRNPFSRTVKAIFYLYSLESYLYGRLNWAARSKNEGCIKNMGCFAAILSMALGYATRYREDQIDRSITQSYTVYRGLSLSPEELAIYKEGDIINLSGYASTSKNRDQSMIFAMKNQDKKAY